MKHTLPTLLLAATLCASAFAVRPARAQMFSGLPGNLAMTRLMLQPIVNQENANMYRDQLAHTAQRGEKEKRGTTKIKAAKALTATTYRESPAVSQRVLTRFTSFVTKNMASKTDAEATRRYFANDTVGRWAAQVAPDGFKRGDVADALAAYFVSNWRIANGERTTTSAQVRAARRQIALAMASNAAFAKLSGAQRQEMAEAFIYNQMLQSAALELVVAGGDAEQIKRYRDGRAASFQGQMKIDLRTVKLTNAGFAAK